MRSLVDHDPSHVAGRHRIGDELLVDSTTVLADARHDRIDCNVVRGNRDLGPPPGFARDRGQPNHTLSDLVDLALEQLRDEAVVRARQEHPVLPPSQYASIASPTR